MHPNVQEYQTFYLSKGNKKTWRNKDYPPTSENQARCMVECKKPSKIHFRYFLLFKNLNQKLKSQ